MARGTAKPCVSNRQSPDAKPEPELQHPVADREGVMLLATGCLA